MSEAKRLINRAIDLIVQGESRGAESVLELAINEVDKLVRVAQRTNPIDNLRTAGLTEGE